MALVQPGNSALADVHSNSGAFDGAFGYAVAVGRKGAVKLNFEGRVYRGAAVNSGIVLVPFSFGIRY